MRRRFAAKVTHDNTKVLRCGRRQLDGSWHTFHDRGMIDRLHGGKTLPRRSERFWMRDAFVCPNIS